MIAYVRGELVHVYESEIIVEAGGIGYSIRVPASLIPSLPSVGEEVRIHTYFYVREDAMSLFGFLSREDRELFEMLIGVSGIGPKGALSILSTITPDDLRFAVLAGDAKRVAQAPGVGLKTAQKLIIEIRDKIALSGGEEELSAVAAPAGGDVMSIRDEAVQALMALGYSSSEALRAIRRAPAQASESVEALLKEALKGLAL